MTEKKNQGLRQIRRALISVSDKTGIVDFARELRRVDVEIISTGGTAKVLRDAGVEVRDVAEVTGFPEMMDGRVKTLHPRVHGALLALRDNAEHNAAMDEHGIEPIDLVVVNLYPFERTITQPDVTLDEAIEQIDIGGPSMIRSAAKNFRDVAVVVNPEWYEDIIAEIRANDASLSLATRQRLALGAFITTSSYDRAIEHYLLRRVVPGLPRTNGNNEDNPCGVALGGSLEQAYRRALACDPVSAFGGIVAFNRSVDEGTAGAVTEIFTEVMVAPGYDDAALAVLRTKKNLRVLAIESPFAS